MKSKTNFKILLVLAVIIGAMLLLGTTTVQANVEDNQKSSYNEMDKNYVENLISNLKCKPEKNGDRFFASFEYIYDIDKGYDYEYAKNLFIQTAKEEIQDNNIEFEHFSGTGGEFEDDFTPNPECVLFILKDKIKYAEINVALIGRAQITIPSNVEDTETYTKTKIQEFLKREWQKDENIDNITINKSNGDYYIISTREGEIGKVIIKKEKTTTEIVKKEDTTTGIKIETTTAVLPSNVVLSSIKVTEQNILNTVQTALKDISNKYTTYDITLLKDNVKIQPNGKIKISIPIPNSYNKEQIEIYRIEENGTKIKYDVKVEGDYAIFETDHFSIYVLAEKQTQNPTEPTTDKGEKDTTPTTNTISKEKDDTPKTGTETINIIGYVLATTIISGVGIVALKKNLK